MSAQARLEASRFGLSFLSRLILIGTVFGIPAYLVMDNYQSAYNAMAAENAAMSQANKQTLQQYQETVARFDSAINEQIARVRQDQALWEQTVQERDPTANMSESEIHDLTYHFTLPTVSAADAASENNMAYQLFSDQALCIDTIAQFNKFTPSVPKGVAYTRHTTGECNG